MVLIGVVGIGLVMILAQIIPRVFLVMVLLVVGVIILAEKLKKIMVI
jgi:hypothetical protein